jgi:hypothetical protein
MTAVMQHAEIMSAERGCALGLEGVSWILEGVSVPVKHTFIGVLCYVPLSGMGVVLKADEGFRRINITMIRGIYDFDEEFAGSEKRILTGENFISLQ